jgi:RhoGAP domain
MRFGDPLVNEHIRDCLNSGLEISNPDLLYDSFDIPPISEQVPVSVEEFLQNDISISQEITQISRGKTISIYSACETLQVLLGSFVEPVIPFAIQERCINEGYLSFSAAKQVIKPLPPPHYNIFVYVMSFLAYICKNHRGIGDINSAKLGKIKVF